MAATPARRAWLYCAAFLGAAVGWLGGLALWGSPQQGFGTVLPLFDLGLVVLVAPVVLVCGVVLGLTRSSGQWPRQSGAALWLFGILVLIWPMSFVHFGGLCMDANDVCVVTWPARVSVLLLGEAVIAAGVIASELCFRLKRG